MPIYFTKKGYENHLKRISELKHELKKLESRVSHTFDVGGGSWHDNADHEHQLRDISLVGTRLKEAYSIYNKAEVISYPTSVDKVVLGCEVKLLLKNEEKIYKIVAYGEEDIPNNKITYIAPLAQIIFDKKKGDMIKGKIGGKEEEIEILDIKPL